MGTAPAVEVADRERIRAGARAKLFGEPPPPDPTLDGASGTQASAPPNDPERVGRFRILDRLGAGGMGVVYSAYDPQLDRKVALKLLRPDLAEDATRGSTGTNRLHREAQAMARLNHPNVVTVHEVGQHEDQVFVAMEFVEGTTLREWVEGADDWREIVRVYCDAAAGLAAAHEAGIVHRDFKPDNVMLGTDGRVRVMDFGLSRADRGEHTEEAESTLDQSQTLTQTGAIMGTPAYMAPEQHNASAATAASDQFAFCVSLWEALAGVRPFAGHTYGELAGNVVMGRVQDPPGTVTAPSRVFDTLRRGLAVKPTERFPSMEPLVSALQADPARTFKRIGAALGLAAAVGAVGYSATRPDPVVAGACDDAGQAMRAAWAPDRRDAVKTALLASQAPYAHATWSTVESMLERYADDWAAAAEKACSTKLVETADATMLDRQTQCLDARRRAFEEVVDLLSSADVGMAQQAVQAVVTLAPVESCADPRRLEAFSVARAPEAVEALSQARAQLARARAHGGLGHYDKALELADRVIDTGRRFDDPSTEAAGLLVRGQYLERKGESADAEKSLRDAIRQAEIAHDHTTRAWALIRLIYVVGRDAKRHDEARALGADAGAVLRMLGADPLLQAGLDMNLGGADRVARALDDALAHYRAALKTYATIYGEAHPETGRALTSLGGLYISRKEPDKAINVLLRAKASFEATLGAQHPFVPVVLSNLGTAYKAQGDLPRAISTLEQALKLRKLADGSDHPGVAKTLFNLAAAQFEARRYEAAIASLREGRRILDANGSADPIRRGRYDLLVGMAQVNLGRLDEARETLKPLLELFPLSRGAKGKYARRTRYYLAIATIRVDLRRAWTLVEVARESTNDDDPFVERLEALAWLIDTAEHGPNGS